MRWWSVYWRSRGAWGITVSIPRRLRQHTGNQLHQELPLWGHPGRRALRQRWQSQPFYKPFFWHLKYRSKMWNESLHLEANVKGSIVPVRWKYLLNTALPCRVRHCNSVLNQAKVHSKKAFIYTLLIFKKKEENYNQQGKATIARIMYTLVRDLPNTWNINVDMLKSMMITMNRTVCLYTMQLKPRQSVNVFFETKNTAGY